TVVIVVATVSPGTRRWLGAAATVAVCMLGQVWLAAPRIEEGHNVFLLDRPGSALEAALPPDVYRVMAAKFDAEYPPQRRCDRTTDGCWRGQDFPDGSFAFSADGIYDHPMYSRRVTGIDFADPVWLRLRVVNQRRFNWNSEVSDVERATRDRRSL